MPSLESIAREFYRCVAAGDADSVIDLLAEHVTWTIPGPPCIPYAGTCHGREGVRQFFQILDANESLLTFEPNTFIVDEARGIVCVLGSETAVALPTGRHFAADWAEVFYIRDGLIEAFEEHIDTFTLAQAYAP